eukprot:CAMPEP_0171103882 /NCGR_PEP_ID=MMETSP0766_2-20121228/59575_1 /TAXON_ID=439317 /ORGANISM="Gambierdiscus australes, Strain CAWD 149" /LENGTH=231 /DNA_ID=CAMNT_0011564393 /DNA_START=46 /DNA_END=741 /DNA_ORIENTATION=+
MKLPAASAIAVSALLAVVADAARAVSRRAAPSSANQLAVVQLPGTNASEDAANNTLALSTVRKTGLFYRELTFGAPFGFDELERELRCNSHVRGTETGWAEYGAEMVQAVRVLYFEPVGDVPTRAVLEAYRGHCNRTDLMICVSPECKVAVFYTTQSQKELTGSFENASFANAHDHPLLKCAWLMSSWKPAGIQHQGHATPQCDTHSWAGNIQMNSTLQADIVPLSARCST